MLFNKKITLYCDHDSGVTLDHILDAAWDNGDGQKFLVEEEFGNFERFCDCGDWECPNKKPEVL